MKRTLWFMLVSLVLLLVIGVLVFGFTPRVSADASEPFSPDMVTIYRKVVDDQNKGNIASVLVAFDEDAWLISPDCPYANPCTTQAAIRKNYETAINDHTQTNIVSCSFAASNELSCVTEVRSDSVKSAGDERIVLNTLASFTNDKIYLLYVWPEPSDAQTTAYYALRKVK